MKKKKKFKLGKAFLISDCKDKLRKSVDDFAKEIAPVYRLLQWKWGGPGMDSIPGEKEIAMNLYEQIDSLNEKCCRSSSGGLFAELEDITDTFVYGYIGFKAQEGQGSEEK